MAYKPVAGAQMAAPNVIPMADIMLVLLIIFMVVTPMLQKTHQVDMAPVNNPRDMKDADKDDAIVVAVTRDGSLYLGNSKISKEEITGQVKDRIANKLDKTVYVKSDARAKYGDVVAVVDEIRSAGVDQLGLLTEKAGAQGTSHKQQPPPPRTNPGDGAVVRGCSHIRLLSFQASRRLPPGAVANLKRAGGGSTGDLAMGMDVGAVLEHCLRRMSCL